MVRPVQASRVLRAARSNRGSAQGWRRRMSWRGSQRGRTGARRRPRSARLAVASDDRRWRGSTLLRVAQTRCLAERRADRRLPHGRACARARGRRRPRLGQDDAHAGRRRARLALPVAADAAAGPSVTPGGGRRSRQLRDEFRERLEGRWSLARLEGRGAGGDGLGGRGDRCGARARAPRRRRAGLA